MRRGADTNPWCRSAQFSRQCMPFGPVCQPDTINIMLAKLFLKPTNRLLAEFEGGFMNEE